MKSIASYCLIVAIALLVGGCATRVPAYLGAIRSEDQVAVLKAPYQGGAGGLLLPRRWVEFVAVNDFPVLPASRVVEVLPGTNKIEFITSFQASNTMMPVTAVQPGVMKWQVSSNMAKSTKTKTFTIVVVAGCVYSVWYEDENTTIYVKNHGNGKIESIRIGQDTQ